MKKYIKDENGITKEVELSFSNMEFTDIVSWCKANNQVEWLKATGAKCIPTLDKKKKPVFNEDGTPKTHRITFIELKIAFCNEFMKDLAPKSKKKNPTMYDIIESL